MTDANRTCPVCGSDLPPRKQGPGRPRIYCSATCRDHASYGRRAPMHRAQDLREADEKACEWCAQPYVPRRRTQRYCSSGCRHEANRTAPHRTVTCETCGAAFATSSTTARYCSRDCRILRRMATARTGCSIDGCPNPHRARGLCATHYNQQHQPQRHRPIEVPCAVCGKPVQKQPRGNRKPVCSLDCRYILTWGESKSERDVRLEAERRSHKQLVGPVRFNKTTEPPTVTIPATFQRLVSAECRECGTWFIDHVQGRGGTIALTCSDLCARRWERRGRRFVTTKVRTAIYDRDNWTCQLCHQPVTRDYDPDDMWSASLDHITPRSHGGTHDPSNLRLTHRYCNAIRSDARLEDAWFISPGA